MKFLSKESILSGAQEVREVMEILGTDRQEFGKLKNH